jgi:non-specific serine/threonine protein kinase/serine/threonine-protein kinase
MASETQSESSSRWTSKQSERIGELLHSALEREPGERVAFLRGACADDEPLLREVRSLLSSFEKAGDFIERPELNVPAMTVVLQPRDGGAGLKPGTAIGRYRIVRRIGEGGMGAVYEAEQENPRRTVALKFINQRLVSPDQLRRFELESQALGRLQHPGIAQIYEAGTAQFGYGPEPYFAMEFIRGETLREYADKHRLSTRERLEMIVRICDAVRHAHQRGLIHRDLKPDNILVDDSGQPKVLDFGVARMTDDDTKATLTHTVAGQLLGTLPYMSPEQALADPLEVDTRSDVYALGVILFELLSARLPYTLSEKMHEALQTIREQDPARLSSINREYRGDIETIVAKALEKDKTRRYASASELAADICRYLRDEPIMARPPSAAYQLQKFARRNKALVAGIAAAFFALSAGVVMTSWLAIGIQKELSLRRIAEEQARAEVARALVAEENARVAEQAAAIRERQAMELARRAAVARDAAQADLLMSQGRYEDAQTLYASVLATDRILSIVVDHEIHWPKFSPDGRWIAFQSRTGDRKEIYVHGPVDPPQILQTSKPVSADGGQCVRWSDDGKQLLVLSSREMFGL